MSGGTNGNRKMLALASAMTIGAIFAQYARATTYVWTRGSGNPGSSNWNNAANWTSPDGGTPPPPQAAADTDLLYTGVPLNPGGHTMNGDYAIRSITINSDFNPGANFNFSEPSTGSAILALGSGGITDSLDSFQIKFTFNSGNTAANQKIVIAAPQTWSNVVSATGGGTLSVDRPLEGAATNTITKSGPGLLILTRDNSAFLGGFNLNDGTIRLANNSNAFGAGTLSALQSGTVGITASTDLPQTIPGQINLGGGGQINFGGSFPFTWNGQVNMLSDKSVSNSATVSITANGAFTGPGRYIKVGGGTIFLNAPVNTHGGFDVKSGFLPIDSDAKLGAAGAALGVGGIGGATPTFGTAVITAPITSSRPLSLLSGGPAGVIDIGTNNVTFGNAAGAGGLTKVGTGVLTLSHVRADETLTVSAGNVVIAPNGSNAGASRVGTLSLAAASSLDLNDNDLVLLNDTYANVTTQIAAARNGGSWNGTGITSSTAAAANPKNKTLGTLTGAEYISVGGSTFDGFTIAPSDVVVKYTYYGDTDFNGVVNFDDYSRTDNGFNTGRSGWLNGDFDYNGVVNFDDYSLIDNAFNTQSGSLRRAMSYLDGSDKNKATMNTPALHAVMDHFDAFGAPYAQGFLNAVPEPTSMVFVGMPSVVGMFLRRRRRSNSRSLKSVR